MAKGKKKAIACHDLRKMFGKQGAVDVAASKRTSVNPAPPGVLPVAPTSSEIFAQADAPAPITPLQRKCRRLDSCELFERGEKVSVASLGKQELTKKGTCQSVRSCKLDGESNSRALNWLKSQHVDRHCAAQRKSLRRPDEPVVRNPERFRNMESAGWGQYQTTYVERFKSLSDRTVKQARAQFTGRLSILDRIGELRVQSEWCPDAVINGIVYKQFACRPPALRPSKLGVRAKPAEQANVEANLCSEEDSLWIEDLGERLRLQLAPSMVAQFVTGMVVALRGRKTSDGIFHVTDVALPRLQPPAVIQLSPRANMDESFVAFMSGLNLGTSGDNSSKSLMLRYAFDFLVGNSYGERDQKLAGAIRLLLICGGTFAKDGIHTGLADADDLFAELASSVCVDLMPGHDDPSNLNLPQMPLHPYLFKKAKQCADFRTVTNPHELCIGDLRLLGHSGQPVEDLLRCSCATSPLAALELSLRASHIAPTAPDTLMARPVVGQDPFVIDQAPHILFSGGHSDAAHSWQGAMCRGRGTLCLCVPAFYKQPTIVLVNMRNPQDVRMLTFDAFGSRTWRHSHC